MKGKINLEGIKIREILSNDLKRVKEFQSYVNYLIKEEVMIGLKRLKSLTEEKEWLDARLKNNKKKKEIMFLAENKGKIVGIANIELKEERQSHVGEFGISIKRGYRGMGLGKRLMEAVLKNTKKLKPRPKIIRLSVFSGNKIAQNLYKKFGFKKVARIPKQFQYKGKLIDEIIMIKELRE